MRKNTKQLRTRKRMRMRIRMMMMTTIIMSIKKWKKKVKKKIVLNTRGVKLIIVEPAKVSLTLCFFYFLLKFNYVENWFLFFKFMYLWVLNQSLSDDLFIWFRGECNKFHFHPWLEVFFLKIMNLITNVYLGKYIYIFLISR